MAFFDAGQVSQCQLGADGFDVGNRIDFACNVNDVVVVKATYNVNNRVSLADVGEELVAQAFAFARACNQTGNVDKFDDGGLHFLRIDDFCQFGHTRIGDFNDADVGFDGTERIVCRFDTRLVSALKRVDLPTLGNRRCRISSSWFFLKR